MQNKKLLFFLSTILILITCSTLGYLYKINTFAEPVKEALSYYGSKGQEVIDIQDKLYKWGYYKGIVDGVYGYKTYSSVKYFQSKNNLKADGVAGSSTLAALGLNTSTSKTYMSKDANLIAHAINGEARGEPYVGQVAVGAVILNRVKDSRFPKTIAGIIYQPGAFDAVSDGQINLEPSSSSYKAARDAMNGWDPSGGAVYYFNPDTATNKWIWSKTIVAKIGKHFFAK